MSLPPDVAETLAFFPENTSRDARIELQIAGCNVREPVQRLGTSLYVCDELACGMAAVPFAWR